MRIVELPKGKTLHLRETPKELPIHRYADFQKYLIQAAGIGSKMEDVGLHFGRLNRFIAAGQTEDAARESYNLYNNIWLMLNKISIDSVAFAVLVDNITFIDNPKRPEVKRVEEIKDYTEEGLIHLCKRMGEYGLTQSMVEDTISEVKKKSMAV